jgi:GT2 family glycosyltransferase
MIEALVITPVKDSLETTRQTLEAVAKATGNFEYWVFDDFSKKETRLFLIDHKEAYSYTLTHLEDITDHPSPNYNLVLRMAQEKALQMNVPFIIIESDVIIQGNTITELIKLHRRLKKPGLIGAITTDRGGNYNFPYGHEKRNGKGIEDTKRSLSFCCTLISTEFLKRYNFQELSQKKDWFDIFISRQSKKMGFRNYLAKRTEVLHLPHSSRPWKQIKYTHPIKYYFYKWIKNRDKI